MSDIPEFGVAIVGPKFVFSTVDDDGEVVKREFRGNGSLTFDEVLEYRTITAELQVDGQLLRKTLTERAEYIDGDESAGRSTDEIRADLTELAEKTEQNERKRWARIIDQMMLLVHPPDRDRLRPLLESGDYTAVTSLRTWLVKTVLNRGVDEAEAVGGVDPTSPSPQDNSASNETGGPDSEPKESSSTD